MEPLVSICCLTYNHEKFIRECLDGFLMQKTNFAFEVLIHDDASTDMTSQIIKEYEKQHPAIIKPIIQKENQLSKGIRVNTVFNFPRAKGKYIAMCEGDDYWTDPYKLQKQVDFLEANSDYVLCAGKSLVRDGDGLRDFWHSETGEFEFNDIARKNFLVTNTVIFRNILNNPLIKRIKEQHLKVTNGDVFLYLALLVHGRGYVFPELFGVYREHSGGVNSKKPDDIRYYNSLNTRKVIIEYLKDIQVDSSYIENVEHGYVNLLKDYLINNELSDDFKNAIPKNLLRRAMSVEVSKEQIKQTSISNSTILKRVLFVNHNIYPFEHSGTPISTLNHALGMYEKGVEVAIAVASKEITTELVKIKTENITLYKLPYLDRDEEFLENINDISVKEYLAQFERILDDFAPQIVHINDYVYMPKEIFSVMNKKELKVVRGVCNTEEICQMVSPVVSYGMKGKLCSGPETPQKCAECFLVNKRGKKKNEIELSELEELSTKFQKRFDSIQYIYDNYVDGVIFTEGSFKNYFTQFVKIPENKIVINPRGFRFDYERGKETINVTDKIRFAYIGNVMFAKGIDVVLNAFEKMNYLKNFHLDIYGEILNQEYYSWIKELEAVYPGKISYRGKFPRDEISNIAQKIDVAIIPSYFDTYNRVVREMLYYNVPVIATDFFGASIIKNDFNGLKVNIGDYEVLAEAMTRLIMIPAKVNELSKGASRTHIPSLEEEIEGIMDFYNKYEFKQMNKTNSSEIAYSEAALEELAEKSGNTNDERSDAVSSELNSLLENSKVQMQIGNFFEAYLALQNIITVNRYDESAKEVQTKLFEEIVKKKKEIGWDPKKSAKLLLKAEEFIEQQSLMEAKEKLFEILNMEPEHLEALNDLSVIFVLENNYEDASKIIKSILKLDPTNEVAFSNMKYLESINVKNMPQIHIEKFSAYSMYQEYLNGIQNELDDRKRLEQSLVSCENQFSVSGICQVCGSEEGFIAGYRHATIVDGIKTPIWRESLNCKKCSLNSRMRASLHLIDQFLKPNFDSKIYLSEQVTVVYKLLKERYPKLVGSEYLNGKVPLGGTDKLGIRNEDFTKLTFENNTLDIVLSFDVFEHVPDYKKALMECYRTLKPGGKILFSVPFIKNSPSTITRATIDETGNITHILPAQYHGNPIDKEGGSLCYYYFGWDVLSTLKEIGFDEADLYLLWSKDYGYLGGDHVYIIAAKNSNLNRNDNSSDNSTFIKETQIKGNDIPVKPKGIICANPFFEFEIDITGRVVVCCTGWLKHSLGNMKHQSIAEVWNSQAARYIRRKMYKGEWEDICNPHCPTIVNYRKFGTIIPFDELHKNKYLTPKHVEEILAGKDRLESTPTYFKLSDSKICNLKCKMCSVVRDDRFVDDKEMIQRRTKDIIPYLDKAKTILMCGNGDPFARKDTRELLINYQNTNPELKFALITNGLLLPKYWDKVKHQNYESIDISIDGASKEVYEKIRTGGKWEDVLKTLDIVKNNSKKFGHVLISMVVMRSNYREIPVFIDFVESYNFMPMFSRIQGMFEDENIFEMKDETALNELRSIIKNERTKKRSVRVIWQDLIEFAD